MRECPKCLQKDVEVYGKVYGNTMLDSGILFKPENVKFFNIPPKVYSVVCSNCGFLELFVIPEELKDCMKEE